MRKEYIKPQVRFDQFSLTQSIAANCGAAHTSTVGGPTHYDINSCGWKIDEDNIYWTGESAGCKPDMFGDYLGEDDPLLLPDGSAVCYNNPDGGNSIFAS